MSHIDNPVLRPDARQVDIERTCQVARELGCAAVCINPIDVALASRLLVGSSIVVVGVVGFPFGATYTAVKVLETELAVPDGADEIDMVLGIGQLRDDELTSVECDIATVVRAAAGTRLSIKATGGFGSSRTPWPCWKRVYRDLVPVTPRPFSRHESIA